MKKWLVVFILMFLALPVNAVQELEFKGFIADEANLLSEQVKYNMNMTLLDLQEKSGADIAVVTLKSLNGQSVEDAALEIGRKYKVGSKEKNNGIVFLTAQNDRKMRIELGTGLENRINISQINDIRDFDILPYYRNDDYESGIFKGTIKLAELTAKVEGVELQEYGDVPEQIPNNSTKGKEKTPLWLCALLALFMPRKRRGFGSGGFGGGGGFGGCGSSGGW